MEDLKRFIYLADHGHMTQSAEELFITQSALSQTIHRLENQLKITLFIPKGRFLELTPDAKNILPLAKKIVELWERAKDPTYRNLEQPIIALGLFDNAASFLAKEINEYITTGQNKLEVTIDNSENLINQLQQSVLDLVIAVINPNRRLPKSLNTLYTYYEQLHPVANKKLRLSSQTPFILYNQSSYTRKYIDDTFFKNSLKPTIFAESTSPTFMKQLAMLGSGVALLPISLICEELKSGDLKIQNFPFTFARQCAVYSVKNGSLPPQHPLIKTILQRFSSASTKKHAGLDMV